MWKRFWLAIVLVALSAPGTILAQGKPNFSGTWVLIGGVQGTASLAVNSNEKITIAQDGAIITIKSAGPNRPLSCRLDGTPDEETYSATSSIPAARTWTRLSQCRWLSSALVLTQAHRNSVSGQAWEVMRTYSLDLQSRHLVITMVGAETDRPYMATATRFYRKSTE